MKKERALFNTEFLQRFSTNKILLPLSLLFVIGVFAGSAIATVLELFQGQPISPLFVSGIPSPDSGFLVSFSTILLNVLIALIILFLLGVTAFGAIGVPLFLLYKGVVIGVGILSFLSDDPLQFASCAFCYAPVAAASTLLLLLFATRALAFSNRLARAGFSSQQENLDFQFYFKDFLSFLCFAVLGSIIGGLLPALYRTIF